MKDLSRTFLSMYNWKVSYLLSAFVMMNFLCQHVLSGGLHHRDYVEIGTLAVRICFWKL